ncbi:ABC transporter permease subunit [Cellulomonas marina]|uniref:ABC-2 type transport system permease protein n=1 Tax=Cellulomonas marina TaxID=988821 RepID=A0A1I1ALF2_9CELL|nr:ABC transporter permease subunit [Cellulomonas marina]GIG30183.1 hypothetical protein Cma02nite_27830 [Cellulomonas marina]SFB37230.1 ABC-2 type transport system permease protein [Cellulomonas marina]
MSRLLRVELRRLRARRLVLVAHVGVLVVVGLLLASLWSSVQPLSAAEVRQAEEFYAQAAEEWERTGEQQVADCREQERREEEITGRDADYHCEDLEPRPEWFLPTPPTLAESLRSALGSIALVLGLAALGIGATFTAAELSTRSMSTWLTFEPRRLRVYGSKVAAAALGVVPLAVVTTALVVGGVVAVYVALDVPAAGGAADGVGSATVLQALRVVALTAVAAAGGAALGILLRHTAAVMGAVLGWVVAFEAILVTQLPHLSVVSPRVNATGWVDGGTAYYTETCTTGADGTICEGVEHAIGAGQSALVLSVGLAVLVAVAALVFRRRDEG